MYHQADSSPINILHVTEACGGGVARHLRLIVPELVQQGFSCAVCGFGQRVEEDFLDDLQRFEQLGCRTEFWPFNHGNLFGTLNFIRHLRALLQDWKPAIIHAHSSMAGLACRIACTALPGVRVVYSPHAFALHPSLPAFIRFSCRTFEFWSASRTDAYAFVGRSEIQDANQLGLPANRFHLIENGLPASYPDTLYTREEARRVLQIPQDATVAVIPCRLARQKGLDQVLRSITLLGDECRNLSFMFCGNGPEKKALQALTRSLGIADRVDFHGSIDRLSVLLKAFDLAILPSLYEGLSYVLLECLASALPLVVSDIQANVPRPELRDVLHTFTLGNLKELAEQITKTITEPKLTAQCAQLGADYMKNNFTLELQIRKLANLYRLLL